MRVFLVTAKIIAQPRLVRVQNKYFLAMLTLIPNHKKQISQIYVYIYVNNYLISNVIHSYKAGSFIVIESRIKIKYNSLNDCFLGVKKLKYVELQVSKLQ